MSTPKYNQDAELSDEVPDAHLYDLLKTKKKKINSRTKGNAFERKISGILNSFFETTEFCRTPGSGAFATTHKLPEHLQVGGDLITPKNFPFLIECKKGYKFQISDLFNPKSEFQLIVDKVVKEAKQYKKSPLLIFQQDRQNILALVESRYIIDESTKESINFKDFTILKLEVLLLQVKPYYTS